MSKVNWFYEVGQEIKDDKRDLVIIDREIRETEVKDKRGRYIGKHKYYKLKCNKCGYEDNDWWIIENRIKNVKVGCPCCANKKAVLGINTIYDTDHWMVKLGVSEEDAKKYTHSSGKKIWVTCPICGDKKHISISKIYDRHSISCNCGDGISYPEKIMYSVLKQLNIKFITQLNKSDFDWCDKYRYDFYLPDYNIIIETHGEQHYYKTFESIGGKTLEEQQKIDKIKKELALNNRINKYIIINCSKSKLEFIKNNILNSEFNNLFDLSKIDWLKCEEYAISNLIKEVCDYKKNNPKLSISEIAEVFGLTNNTVNKYFKIGNNLNLCDVLITKGSSKITKIFKDNILLGVFENARVLCEQFKKTFNIELNYNNISSVCNGNSSSHNDFTFSFGTKKDYDKAVKNNTLNKFINITEILNMKSNKAIIVYKEEIIVGVFESRRKTSELLDISEESITIGIKNNSQIKGCIIKRATMIEFLKAKQDNTLNKIINKPEIFKKDKPVKIFKNDILLGLFKSATILSKLSKEIFNIKLDNSKIGDVCNGKRKTHQGFTFQKATKEEYEEAVKNNTINKRIDNIELEQVS